MTSKTNSRTSRRCGIPKYLLWALLGIAVIVIAVPIAVMFGRKKSSPKATVLVPLYVYPSPGAWDPLFTAITKHPHLNFTIVINPSSGPGAGPIPDSNYTREIPKLNQHANVRTVGYVSTNYTKRNLSAALLDIETYASWSENSTVEGLGMRGIFLDETPSQYQGASAVFLDTLRRAVKAQTGLGGDPLIIHNPGTIPDARYLSSADLTVVFEGTYSTYQSYSFHKSMTAFQSEAKEGRNALAAIVHSLPEDLSEGEEKKLVGDLRRSVGSLFVTGLGVGVDYYAGFWEGWLGWVGDLGK